MQHEFWLNAFHTQHVDDHGVGELEGAVEKCWLSLQDELAVAGGEGIIQHQDDDASVVQAPATRPTTHLDVLSRGYPTKLLAVKLASAAEEDRSGWHVHAHREGFRGTQHLA